MSSTCKVASNFGDYGARQALKIAFGLGPDAPPAHYYLALSSTPIQRDGSNLNEPSGGGYARAVIPPWVGPFSDTYSVGSYFLYSGTVNGAAGSPGVVFHPMADVLFPAATATWNFKDGGYFDCLYLGVYDDPTAGNLIWRLWEEEPGIGGPVDPATGHSVSPGFPIPPKPYSEGPRTVAAGDQVRFGAANFGIGFSNVTAEGCDGWPFVFSGGAGVQSEAFWVPVLRHLLGIASFSPSWSVGLVHSDSFSSPSQFLEPFFEPTDPAYGRRPIGGLSGPTGNRTDVPGSAGPYVLGGGWSWSVGMGYSGDYRDCYPMLFDSDGNWAWLIGASNTGFPSDGETIFVPAGSVAFEAW
jgi:hypothetical protein